MNITHIIVVLIPVFLLLLLRRVVGLGLVLVRPSPVRMIKKKKKEERRREKMDIQQFDQACQALENPQTHSAAARYLEDLRGSPLQSIDLSRRVLSSGVASPLAQFQAILLLRVCVVSVWSHYSGGEGAVIRDWLLSAALQSTGVGSSGAPPLSALVVPQILVTVSVLYKRGWLEESQAARASLFERLGSLCESGSGCRALGMRLVLRLVEEFGGDVGTAGGKGRATALGASGEWHAASAVSFQDSGALRSIFLLALRPILEFSEQSSSPTLPAADIPILEAALEALACVTGWDFEARRGLRRDGRLNPGSSWGDVLGEAGNNTVFSGVLGVYTRYCRGDARLEQAGGSARGVVADLCTLEGGVFAGSRSAALAHVCALLQGLTPLLSSQQSWVDGLLGSLGGGGLLEAQIEKLASSVGEGAEIHSCLATVLRVHRPRRLLSREPGEDGAGQQHQREEQLRQALPVLLQSAMGASAAWIVRLCTCLSAACERMATLPRGSGAEMGRALRERSDVIWSALDSALELWSGMSGELEEEARVCGGVSCLANLLGGSLREAAGGLYGALVTARLSVASTLIAVDIDDDDNPYEDPSILESHLCAVACLGRMSPSAPLVTLARALEAWRAKVLQSPQQSHQHLCEELYWLAQYSISLLTDAGSGEIPVVPPSINALSISRQQQQQEDGCILLSTRLFEVLQCEIEYLCRSGAPRSPLTLAVLLNASERWARTYLFPPQGEEEEEEGGGGGRVALSPALRAAYSGPGGGSIAEFLLNTSSVTAAVLGDGEGCFSTAVLESSHIPTEAAARSPMAASLCLLQRLLSDPRTAPYCSGSPTVRFLGAAVLRMVEVGGLGCMPPTPASAAASTTTASASSPPSQFSRFHHTMSHAHARILLSTLLGLTKWMGHGGEGWVGAKLVPLHDLESLGPAALEAGSVGGGAWGIINALTTRGGCSAITHPSVLLTLQAWGAHAHPFLAALLQRTELLRSTLVNASLETNKTGECARAWARARARGGDLLCYGS